jgi:hypothetical protein
MLRRNTSTFSKIIFYLYLFLKCLLVFFGIFCFFFSLIDVSNKKQYITFDIIVITLGSLCIIYIISLCIYQCVKDKQTVVNDNSETFEMPNNNHLTRFSSRNEITII